MMAHIFIFTLCVLYSLFQRASSQYIDPTFANFSGPNGPLVDLGYIKLQGTRVTSSSVPLNAWAGIRYAAAPSDQQRFRAAVPIEAATEPGTIFDASTYGPYCYQGWSAASPEALAIQAFQIGSRQPSEDCLILDIYAPANPLSSKLPVLVSIHGGAYTMGVGTQIPFGPYHETAPGQFIFISMQYRLAGFGFLGGAAVSQDGNLNVGLIDQRQALKWVQRHISAFGGDPDKVTIQGPSAGGGSVTYHYIWAGGEAYPPFRAGIAEYPWWETYLNSSQLEKQYQEVLHAANCSDISCLRQLSGDEYSAAQQATMDLWSEYSYGLNYFGPTVDGSYIRDLPSEEMKNGHLSKLPLMITHDGNEGMSFTPLNITTNALAEARVRTLFNGGESFFGRLNDFYPVNDTASLFPYNGSQERADYIYGDAFSQCPTYYMASALTDLFFQANNSNQPVYKYIYALPTFQTAPHAGSGALLGHYSAKDTSSTAILSRMFMAYYMNFIIDRDPNSGTISSGLASTLKWPQYGGDSQILLINGSTPSIIHDIDASARCEFWWAHPNNAQN